MEFELPHQQETATFGVETDLNLLTREEEYTLASTIQRGVSARARLELGENSLTTAEQEALFEAVDQSRTAVHQLVLRNVGLVYDIVKRYSTIDHPDLEQTGFVGLLQAAWKFKPTQGARFNTYAYTSILNEVRPTATNLKLPLVLPEHMMPIFHQIQCFFARHQMETGKDPHIEDVIKLLGRDPSKESDVVLVKKYLSEFSRLSPIISFRQRGDSHRSYNLELTDPDDTPYDERIYLDELRRWIDTLPGDVYRLSQQELGVLYLRSQGMSFTQIGDHFGIERQHAHRSYKRALEKLEDSLTM